MLCVLSGSQFLYLQTRSHFSVMGFSSLICSLMSIFFPGFSQIPVLCSLYIVILGDPTSLILLPTTPVLMNRGPPQFLRSTFSSHFSIQLPVGSLFFGGKEAPALVLFGSNDISCHGGVEPAASALSHVTSHHTLCLAPSWAFCMTLEIAVRPPVSGPLHTLSPQPGTPLIQTILTYPAYFHTESLPPGGLALFQSRLGCSDVLGILYLYLSCMAFIQILILYYLHQCNYLHDYTYD